MRNALLGELVDRHEFARQAGVSPRTAYSWHRQGYGPMPRRMGPGKGRLYYVQAEIDAFLEGIRDGATVVA